ncbi:AraC family transcriptional regulator [Roseateles chitinivorans]|uniref:AraC family transcriptional regulator n=1 Tax=Roseateles chitinivorans TaxID=2917965 RepID=UPI003D674AA5
MATTLNAGIRRRIIDTAIRYKSGSFSTPSPVAGVRILYSETSHPRTPVLYEPSIVIVAQGAKVGFLGEKTFRYDADNYLLLTVPLPFECQTIASKEQPFVGVSIDIDTAVLQELLIELGDDSLDRPASLESTGVNSAAFTEDVLCAIERLFDAMHRPRDAKVLGRLILKEIIYHVLCGESGAALQALANRHTHFAQVTKALQHIESNFAKPLSVEQLAGLVNMSVSAFHHNFKAITNTSPLQYVKSYKLHKARLIMLNEGVKAGVAATRVGYESPSQFSREFKRYFGATPVDEVARLRAFSPSVS